MNDPKPPVRMLTTEEDAAAWRSDAERMARLLDESRAAATYYEAVALTWEGDRQHLADLLNYAAVRLDQIRDLCAPYSEGDTTARFSPHQILGILDAPDSDA
jgi:hypothetical protein